MRSGLTNLYILLLIKFVGTKLTSSYFLLIAMSFIFDCIRLTDILASYMHARFEWYLSQALLPGHTPPVEMPIRLAVDCKMMAMKAAEAFRNRGELQHSYAASRCTLNFIPA
jgi:hypothetical protein